MDKGYLNIIERSIRILTIIFINFYAIWHNHIKKTYQ